jgi:hypothetical protein
VAGSLPKTVIEFRSAEIGVEFREESMWESDELISRRLGWPTSWDVVANLKTIAPKYNEFKTLIAALLTSVDAAKKPMAA